MCDLGYQNQNNSFLKVMDVPSVFLNKDRTRLIKYKHFNDENWVKEELKGKHNDFCLCQICEKFKPNTEENCEIAQSTYENCKKYNTVTPMWECPKFKLEEKGK